MKRIMFVTLILLLFVTCSGVWAADNITDEIMAETDDCTDLQSFQVNDFDQSESGEEVLKSNDSDIEGQYVDASEAYEYLNAFRTEENVWYWNSDDATQSHVNTNDTVWLKPLKRDIELENTAKIRAKELSEYFSHTRPDGTVCFTIFPEDLLDYGENIAEGYENSFDVTEGWKETDLPYEGQGHRRNMLVASYNYVGIAGYKINGTIYWVQNFGCRYDPEDVDVRFTAENNTLNPKFAINLPKHASGSFDVYVNGILLNSKSVSNGKAEITVCGLDEGTYEILLSYSGDYNCRPFNLTETIAIPHHENSNGSLTFNHLNTLIRMAGDEIMLENDYVFTDETDSSLTGGIDISKCVSIDGNGHSIDARNRARIFKVGFFEATFKNIRFVNANANLGDEKRYVDGSAYGPTSPYSGVVQEKDGGAIFTYSSLSLVNSTFSQNSALNGGAIYAGSYVSVVNSSFSNNTAADDGGAIYSGDFISIANADFTDNHAVDCGGALYAVEAVQANASVFYNNHNTPVFAKQVTGTGNTFLMDEYMAMFSNATADNGIVTLNRNWDASGTVLINASNVVIDGRGYTIDAKAKSRLFNVTGDNVTVKNIRFRAGSSPGNGGAIHVSSSLITLVNSTFEDCIAQMGGVIYGNQTEIIIINSTFTGNGVKDFSGNALAIGGAVCTDNGTISVSNSNFINNSAYDGGALRADYGFISIHDSYFENNTAYVYGGGAVSCGVYANVTSSTFKSNRADQYGGAIFCYEEAKAYIRNSTFENNTSNHNGGAVCLAVLVEITDSVFSTNRASSAAGAVFLGGNLTLVNSNFTGNSAKQAGALYDASITSSVFITRSNFINNTQQADGAVRIRTNALITDSNFINNHAHDGVGGAVSTYQNLTVSDSLFTNNSAVRSEGNSVGGAIANYGENLNVVGCVFTNNSAHSGGAIANFGTTASVDSSRFSSNSAVCGGACFNYVGFTLVISNSNFTHNCADKGGACFNYYDANLSLSDSIFENNSAEFGGAAYRTDAFNCTFIQNKALYQASAIYGVSNTADKCTFIRNIDYMDGLTVDVATSECTFTDNLLIQRAYFNSVYAYSSYYQGEILYMGFYSITDGSFLENATITVRAYKNNVMVREFEYRCGDYWPVNITEGNYTLQFSVEDPHYEADAVNVTVTVFKKEIADVDISVENVTYPDLTNIEFASNLNGTVYVYIDGYYMDYFDITANEKVPVAYYLTAGSHTVEVSITPANYHFDSKTFAENFTVFKKPTSIVMNVLNASEYENVIVSINSSENGVVIVNAGDVEQSAYAYAGVETQIYMGVFEPGTYVATAKFIVDDNYFSSNASKTFKVFKAVGRQDISLHQNESDVVIGLPQDLAGQVTFSIAGKIYTVSIINGSGLVRISDLDEDFYSYEIAYAGDDNYAPFTITDSIYIRFCQKIPEMAVSEFKNGTGQVNLPDDATGTVILSVNGNDYIFDVVNGIADVILPELAGGDYAYTITYLGDDKYSSHVSKGTLKVNGPQSNVKADPELNISVSDISFGKTAVVTVSINKNVTGNVIVSLNGCETAVAISNGKGSLSISDLAVGSYTVSARYAGDVRFNSSEISASFKVIKSNQNGTDSSNVEPEIVIPPLDEPSSDGAVTVTLPADATGKVTLSINGKDYDYPVENGMARVIIPDLDSGNYHYTITYSGDGRYSSFTTAGTLNRQTPKVDAAITASNAKVTYSAGSYYTIKVNGTDAKPASGAKIVITVKGKIFKTLTATKGIAKFKITSVPGTYKMNITVLGKSVTRTLTVKHIVTLKSVTVKKSAKKLVLQATLAKVNKKYLKNKKVTFKFNGKKYTAKTNAKGVAKITIKSSVLKKLKVGKKVTYQATYLKDTVKKTVKIRK